jgi:hypothetical protein
MQLKHWGILIIAALIIWWAIKKYGGAKISASASASA